MNDVKELSLIKIYLNKISEIPVLTKDEELKLMLRYQNGEVDAKKKIIEHNIKLVVSVAKKYIGFGISFDDLIQEGVIALVKAIEYYDISKGYKFSTFAVPCITQHYYSLFAEYKGVIRIPKIAYYDKIRLNKYCDNYKLLYGNNPSIDCIIKDLNISENKVEFLKNIPEVLYNIISPLDSFDESFEKYFLSFENIENDYLKSELMYLIEKLLDSSNLSERQRNIIALHYGFNDRLYTLEEIAKIYGCTRQNISFQLNKALLKIRYNIQMFNLIGYRSKEEIIKTRDLSKRKK